MEVGRFYVVTKCLLLNTRSVIVQTENPSAFKIEQSRDLRYIVLYPETVKTFKMTNWHIRTAIWQKLTGAQSRVSTKATAENVTSCSLAVINTIQCLTRL